MSVIVAVEFRTPPDRVDDLQALLEDLLPATRSYAGFESLTVHQDQDDPASFIFWEQWATRADYEGYVAWRGASGALDAFGALLAGPPQLRFFDFVGV